MIINTTQGLIKLLLCGESIKYFFTTRSKNKYRIPKLTIFLVSHNSTQRNSILFIEKFIQIITKKAKHSLLWCLGRSPTITWYIVRLIMNLTSSPCSLRSKSALETENYDFGSKLRIEYLGQGNFQWIYLTQGTRSNQNLRHY